MNNTLLVPSKYLLISVYLGRILKSCSDSVSLSIPYCIRVLAYLCQAKMNQGSHTQNILVMKEVNQYQK